VAGLAAAVEAVRRLHPQPDVVIVTGDLADHASDQEYEQVKNLLGALDAPVHVLPGNHDDRSQLRGHFGLQGSTGEPVQYVVELDRLRIVMLDTTIPGQDPGELDRPRLEWLEAQLAARPDAPTLLAMHHPPLLTGVPAWDALSLAAADRAALGEVVQGHPQVHRITAGHVHRTIAAEIGGVPVLTVPSTYVQGRLDFTATKLELVDEPAGFGVHVLLDGSLISHVQPVV
jgi:3',5'-cyclic AMP phosphodiesterase CpdA